MIIEHDEETQLITQFGEVNLEGLRQLEAKYDTYQIDNGIDRLRDVVSTLNELVVNMERLKAGASELIDGTSSGSLESFSVEECGSIGDFAMEIGFVD